MIKFNDRLKQLFIENSYNVSDFSREFEMDYGYYFDYSSYVGYDAALPAVNVILDLCDFFQVSCNYLLGISSVRESGGIGSTYDQLIGLAAVILDSDLYDADFKREFFMGIRGRFLD